MRGEKFFKKFFGLGVEKRGRWRRGGKDGVKNFFGGGIDKGQFRVYIKQA
ncbi:MAG: hypothetical protein IKO05_04315 [Selenomonadaceae bacterium]|nr:hypothetical protein [Selenomonadaceae bacterium]